MNHGRFFGVTVSGTTQDDGASVYCFSVDFEFVTIFTSPCPEGFSRIREPLADPSGWGIACIVGDVKRRGDVDVEGEVVVVATSVVILVKAQLCRTCDGLRQFNDGCAGAFIGRHTTLKSVIDNGAMLALVDLEVANKQPVFPFIVRDSVQARVGNIGMFLFAEKSCRSQDGALCDGQRFRVGRRRSTWLSAVERIVNCESFGGLERHLGAASEFRLLNVDVDENLISTVARLGLPLTGQRANAVIVVMA